MKFKKYLALTLLITLAYSNLTPLYAMEGGKIETVETGTPEGEGAGIEGAGAPTEEPGTPPPGADPTPTSTGTPTETITEQTPGPATDVPDFKASGASAPSGSTGEATEGIKTETTQSSTNWWQGFKNFLSKIGSLFDFSASSKTVSDSSPAPFLSAEERTKIAQLSDQSGAQAASAIRGLPDSSPVKGELQKIYTQMHQVLTAMQSPEVKTLTIQTAVDVANKQFKTLNPQTPEERAAITSINVFTQDVAKAYGVTTGRTK